GAGKSTTIKMLTGILTPTSGEARVAGVVPYRERERNARNIGAVFGQRTQLWWDLPVRESFAILRDIYEVPRAEHAAGRLGLDGRLDEVPGRFGSTWQVRATLADPPTPVGPLPGIALVRRDGPQVVFGPDGPAAPTVHKALKLVIERYEVTGVAVDEAD